MNNHFFTHFGLYVRKHSYRAKVCNTVMVLGTYRQIALENDYTLLECN